MDKDQWWEDKTEEGYDDDGGGGGEDMLRHFVNIVQGTLNGTIRFAVMQTKYALHSQLEPFVSCGAKPPNQLFVL